MSKIHDYDILKKEKKGKLNSENLQGKAQYEQIFISNSDDLSEYRSSGCDGIQKRLYQCCLLGGCCNAEFNSYIETIRR